MRNSNWTEEDIYLVAELGHSLHLQGRYWEASVIFQGLVAADPENLYCHESLAAAWIALEKLERAIEQLNILLTRQPSDLAVRARRLEAYMLAGNFAAAIRDFEFLEHLLPAHQVRCLELSLEAMARRAVPAGSQRMIDRAIQKNRPSEQLSNTDSDK
jgi:tetratricopeptide (TPR) repeat protein